MTIDDQVLIEAHDVRKRFGGTQALGGVDFTLHRGEVHALLGPNGAGKSTFIKILDGLYRADKGSIDRRGHRLAFIHQDLGLVPDLTVRENLGLAHGGGYRRARVLVDTRRERGEAERLLELVGLDVEPETMLRDLGLGERTLVAVARALDQDAEILVLDEVTAGLTTVESEWLFEQVEKFAARGNGVMVVSHRLHEIVQHCATTTLFRDGIVGYQGPTPDLPTLHGLFAAAEKREFEELDTGVDTRPENIRVSLRAASTTAIGPVSLSVHAGEVVGIVGQLTSGLYDLGHLLAGHTKLVAGETASTSHTGKGKARIAFVPEDRWGQGLLPDLSVAENVSIASLPRFSTGLGWIRMGRERERAERVVRDLSVSPARTDVPVGALSGGNAQKVLMGRAATIEPDVYVLCEPTRGVDVTTREAIYGFIRGVRAGGAAVVIITIDLDDALAVSDRVGVMRDGQLSTPIARAEVVVEDLLPPDLMNHALHHVAAAAPHEPGWSVVIDAYHRVLAVANDEHEELEPVLQAVAEQACALLHSRRAGVYLRDDERETYVASAAVTDGADRDDALRLVCGGEADGFTRQIMRERRPVFIADAQHDLRPVRSAMRTWRVQSILGVPMIAGGDVVALLFVDDGGRLRTYDDIDQDRAAAFAALTAGLVEQHRVAIGDRRQLSALRRQNQLLRRVAAMDEAFGVLSRAGAGITEILDRLAEMTGKSCAVLDGRYEPLAECDPTGVLRVGTGIRDPEYRGRAEVAEALEGLSAERPGLIGPFPHAGLHCRSLIAPAGADDSVEGYVVLEGIGSRFSALDMEAAKRAAVLVAQRISAERRVAAAEAYSGATIVRDLVATDMPAPFLIERAVFHGLGVDTPHVVGVIAGVELSVTALLEASRAVAPTTRVLASDVDGDVVFIMAVDTTRARSRGVAQAKQLATSLARELGPVITRIALSSVCVGPHHLGGGYHEARELMELRAADGDVIVAVDDLGVGRLFLGSAGRGEVERFARDTLGPLFDHEHEHGDSGELLTTLVTFFERGKAVRKAGERLGVHENTVRYRLGRVAEITGLDFMNDCDDQLLMHMAVLAQQHRPG